MVATEYASCRVYPGLSGGYLQDVWSQHEPQLTPRNWFAAELDNARLEHPVFDEAGTATQCVCRLADQHDDAADTESMAGFSEGSRHLMLRVISANQ